MDVVDEMLREQDLLDCLKWGVPYPPEIERDRDEEAAFYNAGGVPDENPDA